MGYRNDIYIAVKNKDYEDLMKKITTDEVKNSFDNEYDYKELLWLLKKHADVTQNCFKEKDYLEIFLKYVKWTSAIYYISDWLNEIEDFELVVFGEELGDTEHIASDHEFYDVVRKIVRNN